MAFKLILFALLLIHENVFCKSSLCILKRQRFRVWYLIRLINISLPGHWTCLFVWHFNCNRSTQPCSYFGVWNWSYILASPTYQVLVTHERSNTNIETCREGRNMIILCEAASSGDWTQTTGILSSFLKCYLCLLAVCNIMFNNKNSSLLISTLYISMQYDYIGMYEAYFIQLHVISFRLLHSIRIKFDKKSWSYYV